MTLVGSRSSSSMRVLPWNISRAGSRSRVTACRRGTTVFGSRSFGGGGITRGTAARGGGGAAGVAGTGACGALALQAARRIQASVLVCMDSAPERKVPGVYSPAGPRGVR
jgi:hypothetical protein